MYCQIISYTGWTWDYVGQNVTLIQANALFKHWNLNPPLQRMVAAYLGIDSTPQASATIDEVSEFIPAQRLSAAEFDEYLRKNTSLLIEDAQEQ